VLPGGLVEALVKGLDGGGVGLAGEQSRMDVLILSFGFDELALLLLAEEGFEQEEVEADEGGVAEALVFDLVGLVELGLAVVVDQEKALLVDQGEQAFQALEGAVTVRQAGRCALAGEVEGDLAVGDRGESDGLVGVLGGEQAVQFEQFAAVAEVAGNSGKFGVRKFGKFEIR
jgi:hypothetical protein